MFPTQRSFFRFMVILTLLLALIAPTMSASVHASPTYTDVGGPIISDTTWTPAGNPYIVTSNIQVMTGVTLTAQSGVIVRFNAGKMMEVDGTLIARGSPGNPVTFTSNQANPAPGDWGNIEFTTFAVTTTMDADGNYLGGSILQYCTVEYAGDDTAQYGAIEGTSLLVDHCIVRNNHKPGVYVDGTPQSPARIANNTIISNYGSGVQTGNYSTIFNNIIKDNSNIQANGGGIYAAWGTVQVVSNTITGNSALVGGGISGGSYVAGNTISGNIAIAYGGGIMIGCSAVVSNNTIMDNFANRGYGGGIEVDCTGVDPTIVNNSIIGNIATVPDGYNSRASGGGIYAGPLGIIENNVISNNKVVGTFLSSGGGLSGGRVVMNNTISCNV